MSKKTEKTAGVYNPRYKNPDHPGRPSRRKTEKNSWHPEDPTSDLSDVELNTEEPKLSTEQKQLIESIASHNFTR